MSASKLARPALDYKDSFLAALAEFRAESLYDFVDVAETSKDFKGFVDRLNAGARLLHHPAPDWLEPVPETLLWLVKDEDFIGTLHIRHRLNWHLERWGGHMNFAIRPSWRGKGFGKKLLRKALPAAAALGVERALLTVRPGNAAGIHVIEDCGGVFADETDATERFPARRRYWIECVR
ncbi:MAG TPA: GNAT family N-acetyltransferase [Rhodospirillaceae bacterium]|jgi:predicted acetyltransferase|nr:GNAT family N-acetyltransferase [Alphaproteobacteria bacterium]HBH26634.1 GNAT family N-acetyltransferase [Rhodospirillaceae bacterium]